MTVINVHLNQHFSIYISKLQKETDMAKFPVLQKYVQFDAQIVLG